ncbi:MAG: CapA family protein, partial [Carnobacterium sp.]|uniref:CapA family protein n=1 Tax=Carnobacterium sp. TaxID=48221 RepID=UPI002FC8510F
MKKIGFLVAMLVLSGCANQLAESPRDVSSASEPALVSSSESSVEPEDPHDEEKRISFVGVGDNLIHNVIFEEAQLEDGSFDFKPMFEYVADPIETADLAFINQETLIGGDTFGFSGYPDFNTPSDMADNLKDLGFDLVNGASNHSLDKGKQGVLNTLEIWEQQEDMVFTGVFDSQEQRDAIPVIERDGLTFSFLAYT